MRKLNSLPLLWCVGLYVAVAALLIAAILKFNHGHFFYGLDDPYIHLALAENLANGHYGINPNEYSSPSSSILWPLLLVPLSRTGLQVYLPLVFNLIFGVIASALLGLFAERWIFLPQDPKVGIRFARAILCILLIFAANLWTLTILGMEHVLQVLLAICCAYGLMKAYWGEKIPLWALMAAAIGPSVRYENVSLFLAMVVLLVSLKLWREALAVLVVGAIPLVVFSLFLKSLGLPPLPLSVLVKGNTFTGVTFQERLALYVHETVIPSLRQEPRLSVLIMTLALAYLAFSARGTKRTVLSAAAVVGFLQLSIGRFGWMDRYEDYAVIFIALILLGGLADWFKGHLAPSRFALASVGVLVLLAIVDLPYVKSTRRSVLASEATYRQQDQMHRFVTEFYKGDYAVNDLGLVSYERRPGAYVLDVYGLASFEAARQSHKTAEWLEEIVARHNIEFAMLYPEWFDIPQQWTPVGRLCIKRNLTHMGKPCVNFYATSPEAVAPLQAEVLSFAKTLPDTDAFYVSVQGGWRQIVPTTSAALFPPDVGD